MNELLAPTPGEIWVLHTPPQQAMLSLVARMAINGPLLVFDAGDQFDAFHVAGLIRAQTTNHDRVLGQVRVARAFTCHQVVSLFGQLPAAPMPHVIFDLPATFCDEGVTAAESALLLRVALRHVERLRRAAPIIMSVRPARAGRRAQLVQTVTDLADHMFVWETPSAPTPVRLF